MKVIVAGGRDFSDYQLMKDSLDKILNRVNKDKLVIVSGTARGADQLGEKYAKEKGYKVDRHPAKWNRQPDGSYDRAAGYKRNKEMAEVADALVAFWNGSKGTKHMIDLAKEKGLKVRVVKY